MKSIKILRFFISISVVTVILFFSGCGDDNTSPSSGTTAITVNGRAIDNFGAGISSATVVIGDQTATSAADGSFSINNVKTPYDLKIIYGGTTGIIYKGLNTSAPLVRVMNANGQRNSSDITVTVPASIMTQNKRAIIIFSDSLKYLDGAFIIGPDNNVTFTEEWAGSNTLTGKIIALIATANGNGDITGYTQYGEKSFTLNSGSPANVTFGTGDFPVTPGNTTVSGTVIIPSGYSNTISYVLMSNVTANYLYAVQPLGNSGTSYNFTIPTGLPASFRFFVKGMSLGVLPEESTQKLQDVLPGSSGNSLTLDHAPSLSTPTDNATGIDTNTIFTYSSASGSGVYLLSVSAAGKEFYVVTSNTSANIPNLASYGLTLGSSVTYHWGVTRYFGINSPDEIVSTPFLFNTNSAGLIKSTLRTFVSAP